ncbi:MAG: hypothetical protein LBC41_01075, partial [Clostridiales bacterium]|nr:hypothetical protein [Clostridiales bacterium]
QERYLLPLRKLIEENDSDSQGASKVDFEVMPALLKKPNSTKTKMYLNPYDLSDWLPNTFVAYEEALKAQEEKKPPRKR